MLGSVYFSRVYVCNRFHIVFTVYIRILEYMCIRNFHKFSLPGFLCFVSDAEGEGGAFDGQQTVPPGQVSPASWHTGGSGGQSQENGIVRGDRQFEKGGQVDVRGTVDGLCLGFVNV